MTIHRLDAHSARSARIARTLSFDAPREESAAPAERRPDHALGLVLGYALLATHCPARTALNLVTRVA
ncbi:hypothetical protein [Streptomyces olivaceus]|uniref:hypothetical protein n=1 Tax=Streptomyces olivaceus TaxID=47716 RepID=UPI004056C56E